MIHVKPKEIIIIVTIFYSISFFIYIVWNIVSYQIFSMSAAKAYYGNGNAYTQDKSNLLIF